jgi:mRNA-degrading endonuclease toxin of MazEF toxin-antitoxin module
VRPRRRGGVYFADLGPRIGRKRVAVVSYEGINRGLRQPVCALITSRDRPRELDTYVEIHPPEGGIRETSFVLCHYLITVPESSLDEEPEGLLTAPTMLEVRDGLRRALDLS